MQGVIYVPYERLYGSRSTREELIAELQPFALSPLLKLLAALNDDLRSDENRPNLSVQNRLLQRFFPHDEIGRMSNLGNPPVVIHRQQVLFLMKKVLRVCCDSGIDAQANCYSLGRALLRANDLLAHSFPKATTTAEKALVAAAHSFSIQEAGGFHSFEYKMLRSFWMLRKTLPHFREQQLFFNIEKLFEDQTHLGLIDFYILQYMTMISFIKEIARSRSTPPIDLPETWFSTTDFSEPVVSRYLLYVSSTVDQLRQQVSQQHEPSDFTAFRETPIVRLDGRLVLIDFRFLCEKAESGPFWAARRQIENPQANDYFSFWGNLFEQYVSDILRLGSDPKFNKVIPNPHFVDGDQATDCAVLCGDALVLIETKTSTISARVKYGADIKHLDRTLKRNFVEDGKSPKALRQLANVIRKLFRDRLELNGIEANKINRIFPVLVTRDEVGATVGINLFLNDLFQELLRTDRMKIPQSIAPLVCLSVEDIERFSPRGKEISFDKVLEGYFRGCKRDGAKLKPFGLTPNAVLRQLPDKSAKGIFVETLKEIGSLVQDHIITDDNTDGKSLS